MTHTAPSARAVVLTIPTWQPLSMNTMERMGWYKRYPYRNAWASAVFAYWLGAGRPTFQHPRITIRCYYATNRKRDADNAAGGVAKIVMDALKGHAFGDDDAGSVDLQPVQLLLDRDNPRVEIELEKAG